MGVRPDRGGLGGQLVGRAVELELRVGLDELDPGVRVDDRRVGDVVVELLAGPHVGLEPELDAGAVGAVPGRRVLDLDLGLVVLGVDDELVVAGLARVRRPGGDLRRRAAGELGVEDGRGDADALLAAGLLALVEPRAVQQLPEDLRDLLLRDARAVVLDDERVVVAGLPDLDVDVGQDAGLLGGVERVVDGLLDGRDERPGLRVEPEHVLVLLEELGDGDRPLARGELVGDVGVLEARLERGHSRPALTRPA